MTLVPKAETFTRSPTVLVLQNSGRRSSLPTYQACFRRENEVRHNVSTLSSLDSGSGGTSSTLRRHFCTIATDYRLVRPWGIPATSFYEVQSSRSEVLLNNVSTYG